MLQKLPNQYFFVILLKARFGPITRTTYAQQLRIKPGDISLNLPQRPIRYWGLYCGISQYQPPPKMNKQHPGNTRLIRGHLTISEILAARADPLASFGIERRQYTSLCPI